MLGGFSVHSGKKLDEIFSKCRQRKAKDKEKLSLQWRLVRRRQYHVILSLR